MKYGLCVQGLPFSDVALGLSMLLCLLCSKARDSCLSTGKQRKVLGEPLLHPMEG